jgi:hypothetical protein
LDPRRIILHYVGVAENADERDTIDRGGIIIRSTSIGIVRGALRFQGINYANLDALLEAHADTLTTPLDRSYFAR